MLQVCNMHALCIRTSQVCDTSQVFDCSLCRSNHNSVYNADPYKQYRYSIYMYMYIYINQPIVTSMIVTCTNV